MRITFKVRRLKWDPDSYDININGVKSGEILRKRNDFKYGWWVRKDEAGVPLKNTWTEQQPLVDLETAKAQVKAYVKQCLSEVKQ